MPTCMFTTYRHRFARAAPAPRAKRNDSKRKDSKNRGRASPIKCRPDLKARTGEKRAGRVGGLGKEVILVHVATQF